MSDDDNAILSKDIQEQISGIPLVEDDSYFKWKIIKIIDSVETECNSYNKIPDIEVPVPVLEVIKYIDIQEDGAIWKDELKVAHQDFLKSSRVKL